MKPTEQIVNVEFKDHDKIILTNSGGDTYTSKSEELINFFTRSHGEAISQMQPEWVACSDRLPSLEEQLKDHNWKFLVANLDDNWTDAAYFNINRVWYNGECEITPTHWAPLPQPPTK